MKILLLKNNGIRALTGWKFNAQLQPITRCKSSAPRLFEYKKSPVLRSAV